ncbi:nuclease-related domain-containing protein [Thalassobacillus sp. B23F22_16]|uniref:nuclease-related domain-containing protein n=1 Tax=Thalassobacillus sp. B23F22_16 TaxID=3459513 RepID=UPI00373E4CBB
MFLKRRVESDELLAMRYLHTRMKLTEKELYYYHRLEKGYRGEVTFDRLTENFQKERYIINDLLLEINQSYFQIDTIIISQGTILLLDIKNFEGDYYIESDKFFSVTSGRELKNPVDQLKRSTILFRQLLQDLNLDYLVEAFVIFLNPEFSLYQAPLDQPIILPTQVNRFLKELNQKPSHLNARQKKHAQQLISLHQTKNPFTALPD